jgi:hypothetical protein
VRHILVRFDVKHDDEAEIPFLEALDEALMTACLGEDENYEVLGDSDDAPEPTPRMIERRPGWRTRTHR